MNSNHNTIKKYCPVCKNDLVDMDNIYKCVCRYNVNKLFITIDMLRMLLVFYILWKWKL
jgi:hypothetical protein